MAALTGPFLSEGGPDFLSSMNAVVQFGIDHYGESIGYARKRLPFGTAEDVVGDLFLKLLQIDREVLSPQNYWWVSLQNACASFYRSRRRREISLEALESPDRDPWFADNKGQPDDVVLTQEAVRRTDALLEQLTPKERVALRLHLDGGRRLDANTRVNLFRGRRRLKALMGVA